MGARFHAWAGWARAYDLDLYERRRASRHRRSGARPRTQLLFATCALALFLTAPVGLKAATLAPAGVSFTVTSTADARDRSPGDGACASSSGACTLRAAIQETNALTGADTIVLPAGTYELAILPLNQNLADVGDLDITDSLAISGAGAGGTIIDGGTPPAGSPPQVHGLDRVFEVTAEIGTVAFADLTIREGWAAEYGGGIMNSGAATVTVADATLSGNGAGKTGGAIENHAGGTVEIRDSVVRDNYAAEAGSALNNNRGGAMTVANSTVSSNSAADAGLDESLVGAGAIANNAELDAVGALTIIESRIADNRAGGGRNGAGISNDGKGTLVVTDTTLANNRAIADGGAMFNLDGPATVTRSTFTENVGNNGGAISSSGQGSLTVADSVFTKNVAGDWGGAIQNGNKGSVAIRSSTFTENTGLNGGGFGNEGSGLVTVDSSTFTKNAAVDTATAVGGEGGGMHSNSGGEVIVTGSSFVENRALSGGGLSNEGGGVVSIARTRFEANRADESGGGILIQSGDVRMVDIDVLRNASDSPLEGGGGISYAGDKVVSIGETASLESSRIRDNTSNGQGGGIDSRGDGPLVVLTTSITGNTAVIGGAIHHVGDASLLVTRSTLSGNSAENGGGIFTDGDGETAVENSTVSGNRAAQFGGGLLVSSRLTLRSATIAGNAAPSGGGINNGGGDLVGDGTVFLANSIFAGNTGGNCAGTMTSRGGNVESADTCQLRELSDQPGTDPRLGPLAANGGPTATHALLSGSPAQDKAACTEIDPCPSLDQRGVRRPALAGFDAGAYESELPPEGDEDQACTGRTERPVLADYDSWISQNASGSNFAGDSILRVSSQGGANQRALVHFTLPAIPPGCELVGATLRLFSSSATEGRTLEALRVQGTWTETGVTWANQPATAGAAANADSGLDVREWDVREQALGMYSSGANGFLIRDRDENGTGAQSFHSREKGDREPELVLVFDDPDATPGGGDCSTATPLSLAADRDSWVSESSPTNNFGTDSSLKVKSQTGANARALVRFPLPTLPAGCTGIASATLRLEAASAKEGRTIEARRIASAWSELGVTWSNQPGAAGAAVSIPSLDGLLEWGVTAQVVDMYLSANHGFQIRDADENGVGEEQTLNGRLKLSDGAPELLLVYDDSTPETYLDSVPPWQIRTTTATFRFSSDREDATFECSLDGGSFQACTSPHTVTGLTEGSHSFQVRARRNVRAVDPTPATHTWKVAIPPRSTVSGPASPSATTSATLHFTADDPAATFACALDASAYETCTSPVELTDLADGSHTFRVQATDELGNVEPEPVGHVWTVADPPETKIDSAPAELSRVSSPEFAFSADEDGSTFECKLDGGDWASCPSPSSYPGLGDGAHTFAVRAVDPAENTDPDPATYAWTIDTSAPDTTIDAGPATLTNDATPSFAFSSETGASFECALGGAFAACDSPYDVTTALEDGRHTFQVRATDEAGNTGEAASLDFTVDTQGPVATITAGPSGPTNDPTPDFAFSSEDGASLACALGGAYAACTSPYVVVEPLPDATYAFEVRATDAAGNIGDAASRTFTVDTVGPTTTITGGPTGLTNDSTPSFEFGSEDGATFVCALGTQPAQCESPYDVTTPLADDTYTFEVQATDAAGNAGELVSVAFTVDTEAPATTIDSGPQALTNDPTPEFTFSSEDGAAFACSLGGEFEACTSPYEVTTPLDDGPHTFLVQATDPAGNAGAPASLAFTLDTQGPATTITAGPTGPTSDATPSFEFTSETDATFECSLGGAYEICTSPYDVTSALGDGPYSFDVRATDAAGNTGEVASRAFTVDTVGPTTTITGGPTGLTNDSTPSFEFESEDGATFACTLAAQLEPCVSPYEVTTPLADAAYTFRVQATDAVGNVGDAESSTFTVDTQGPGVALDGPTGLTNDSTPTFTFTSEDGASFACALDGAFAECESPYEVTAPLGDGEHTFRVQATDPAGNPGEVASLAFTVDTVGPAVELDGPSGVTRDSTPTFTFTSEDGASFACALDGAFAECESPYEVTAPLGDGEHTFRVKATDGVGNTGDVVSRTFTVDTQGPATTITAGPSGVTNDATPSFEFSSETGADLACRVDGGAHAACDSPYDVTDPLTDGNHTFQVRATDAAGNTGDAASRAFTVDTVGPTVSLTGPSGLTNDNTPSFAFSAADASGFRCSLGGAAAACTSPYDVTVPLADGDYRFEVTATDAAGNSGATAGLDFTVDTGAPVVTIASGPDDPTTARSAQFTFSADDTAAMFACKLDAGDYAPCDSGVTYEGPLSLGPHVFQVRASDGAGNEGAPDSHTWTIEAPDTAAPVVTILEGPDNPTTETSAQFTFTADDSAASFQCKLDAGDYGPCTSGVTYDGPLALGEHLFLVKATDRARNEGAPASYAWTIEAPDTTAPTVTITDGPDNPTTATSAQFTWTSDDAGASYQCLLDTGAWEPCTSGKTYPGPIALGEHLFQVKGTDSATNEGAPTSYAWTIEAADTTAPTVSISNGPTDPTTARSAQFTFSADEAAIFQCRLDTGAYETCSSGHTYPGPLALGDHEFQVKGTDTAGNEGAAASYSWTIEAPDTTAPVVTIADGPDNPTTARSAQFTFSADDPAASFQCKLDAGDYGPCSSGVAYDGPLALGEHLFQVKATDTATNEGAPASYAWTIEAEGPPPDRTPPVVSITSGPASGTSTTARFEFSANEPIAGYTCSLDGGPLADCASGLTYSGLVPGPHTFLVQGRDAAGNVGSATWSWTVETTPPPPACTPQTLTVAANADTWLLESSPRSTYGQDSVIKVDSKAGANARALVRFPLPATPAGCTITGAKLRLYASSYKTGRTLEAVPVGSSWNENAVTWALQPSPTGADVTAPSGSGYIEWSVTSLVSSGSSSFLIKDESENGGGIEQGFHSREKAPDNPPQLVITFG